MEKNTWTRALHWKTSFCCLSDGDDGGCGDDDDDGGASMMLWVLEDEERREVKEEEAMGIYFCREEELEVQSSPSQAMDPDVCVLLVLSPALSPPL